jgi:hypothetical protein
MVPSGVLLGRTHDLSTRQHTTPHHQRGACVDPKPPLLFRSRQRNPSATTAAPFTVWSTLRYRKKERRHDRDIEHPAADRVRRGEHMTRTGRDSTFDPMASATDRMDGRRWEVATATAIAAMLTYFVATNHIELPPLNNLADAGPQLPSTLVAVIPFTVYALGFAFGRRPVMVVGAVHSWIWLALQIRQWWVPYLFGPSPVHRDLSWFEDGGYADTLHVLPAVAGRPVPDVQHLILEVVSAGVAMCATVAVVRARGRSLHPTSPRRPVRHPGSPTHHDIRRTA